MKVPAAQGTEERMEALRSSGVNVVVEACDVAEESSVLALLERIQDTHGPLRVVVHASGLIEDRSIYDQDADSFRKVFEPKALGAWHLHRHTMGDRLHAFVLCSSVAALFGSRGQANYAAASGYLDELARLRTAHDLPAVSLQWPGVSGRRVLSSLDKKTAKSSISLTVVRQVFKLAVAGAKDPGEPVQAVLPGAYLSPTSTTVRSLLEPLLARRKAWQAGFLPSSRKPRLHVSNARGCGELLQDHMHKGARDRRCKAEPLQSA
ncbi:pks15/1 [Symbiodinium necroappetens]|uniref:Pks15/1 protein n=1 Tax=Symbiodinium necroappetens TaxID=1628268 RepID=A0A812TY82_9DINO|nr:pks15/1 [Symbiodinium necroappetens]